MIKKQMITSVTMVFAIASLFLMTSCAKQQITDQEVTPAPPPPKAQVVPPPPKVDTEAMRRAEEERQARLAEMQMANRLRDEVRAFEAEAIYFDFDKSELKSSARAILAKKAEWLRKNPQFSLSIEGHCDERGTIEYNLALGERRANAAWKFLNALGVSGSRMTTISYGEESPADPAHNAAAWARNRRDEFKLDR
jgi:peptidoglycan-associated lipoprotein